MLKSYVLAVILPLTVVLIGCEAAGQAPQSARQLLKTECRGPRPEVCTFQYQPVCGLTEAGQWKTFSNGCMACTEAPVLGYRDGACEEGAGQE